MSLEQLATYIYLSCRKYRRSRADYPDSSKLVKLPFYTNVSLRNILADEFGEIREKKHDGDNMSLDTNITDLFSFGVYLRDCIEITINEWQPIVNKRNMENTELFLLLLDNYNVVMSDKDREYIKYYLSIPICLLVSFSRCVKIATAIKHFYNQLLYIGATMVNRPSILVFGTWKEFIDDSLVLPGSKKIV
jgi:hypothetical protein